MEKSILRKTYMQMRMSLSTAEVDLFSEGIVERFSSLPLSGIRYLHTFYPITGKHEFNSLLLRDYIKATYPGISLVLPKSDLLSHRLSHIAWKDDTPLAMNAWGITEPEEGEEIDADQIDMVIVPLLAFDRYGNRLGYGKGFYDRFLMECRPDTRKVGVSFFEPASETIDTEPHDIPLDICLTPHRVWTFDHYKASSSSTGQ